MRAIVRILAMLLFAAVLSTTGASKDKDGSIYDCLSGHECQGAIITTHQEGVDYCCEEGHTLILEMDSGTDEENWFEFDDALWSDVLHLFMTQGDTNEKSADSDERGSGGRGDKKRGSNFRDDGLTEPGPDGVAIDTAFIVSHSDLGTSSSADFDVDVQSSVNVSLPEASLPGQKPKAEVESFAEDDHYPTANYDNVPEFERDSPRSKGVAESDDQSPGNKVENVAKYRIPASDMETLLTAFFPRSHLARKLTRRDADVPGGEGKRDVDAAEEDGSQDSINPNVVTLRSLGTMVVTPDAWMVRCLCNARGRPQATDLLGVVMEYLKKLWFF